MISYLHEINYIINVAMSNGSLSTIFHVSLFIVFISIIAFVPISSFCHYEKILFQILILVIHTPPSLTFEM